MKRFVFRKKFSSLVAIAALAGYVLVQSCSSDVLSELPQNGQQKNLTKSTGSQFLSWEAELNYGIKLNMHKLQKQGLSLIGYELQIGSVAASDIATDPIDPNTKIPVYSDSTDWNAFTLQPFCELDTESQNTYREYKNIRCEENSAETLKAVTIRWSYKNENFETTCYVSDDKIVYDPIVSNIRFITYSDNSVAVSVPVSASLPVIKQRSEPGSNYKLSQSYSNGVSYAGLTGDVVASASVYVELQGNTNSDGQKSVENFVSEAPFFSAPWYGAQSQIKVTSFQTGPYGYIEFEYAIGVSGFGGSVSFGYTNGVGFTIPSGVQGTSGTVRINASDLR